MPVGRTCLGEDEVLALLGGSAAPTARARIEEHLDGCATCRGVVAALAATGPGLGDGTGPTFAAGEEIAGRYRIVRFIAQGGMGEVYEATDVALGEAVALKTVSAAISDERALVERLKREVQLARRVSHENVCRIFDWTSHRRGDEVLSLLTMELLVGETLEARLRRDGRLAPADARPLLAQIAAGLDAAHRAGVIHRNLKPANVFLVPAPPSRVVVTDFGLARTHAGDDGRALALTRGPVGTPRYMAPEQERGDAVTAAADVYSFGCVIRDVVSAPDASWSAAIARCLAEDPAARPPSAGAVMRMLTPPRRRARWFTAGAGAVIAIAAVTVAVTRARGHVAPALRCVPRPAGAADVYVDADADTAGEPATGTVACPYPTLTAALDAVGRPAAPLRVHVAAGTYDAAHGERFPLIVRGAIAIEGAGRDVTRVVGGAPFFARGTSGFDGPLPITVLIGDEHATTELARLSIASGTTTADLGGYGVLCDRGNLGPVDDASPHPPSTILRDVDLGPNYDIAASANATEGSTGCNLRVDHAVVHEARIGIWAVGQCWVGDGAPLIAAGLEVVGSTFTTLKASREPWGVGINVWDCVRSVTIRDNELRDSGMGVSVVNHGPGYTHLVVEKNRFYDLSHAGLVVSRGARLDRLIDNSFLHISGGSPATVGDRGVALLLDSATEEGSSPKVVRARGNSFEGNDVGIELRGTTPSIGVLDFGRPDDPGGNTLRCNATASGAAVAGHDVVVRTQLGAGAHLDLAGNVWDHAPPARGAAPNGADLDVESPGRAAIDVTGAIAGRDGCALRVP